jgi:hypothetical protein
MTSFTCFVGSVEHISDSTGRPFEGQQLAAREGFPKSGQLHVPHAPVPWHHKLFWWWISADEAHLLVADGVVAIRLRTAGDAATVVRW